MATHQCSVIRKNKKTAAGAHLLSLADKIQAQPGQFVMVWLPGQGERPFSVLGNNPFSLLIAARGKVSRALCQRKRGEKIWWRGPYGRGFEAKKGKILLLAGGYGVSPLYFLARRLKRRRKELFFVLGGKKEENLPLRKKLEDLPGKIIFTTEDGSRGEKGKVTQIQERLMKKMGFAQVYACGPVPMLKEVVRICRENKTPFQISLEREIRCGLGVCGACHWGKYLICRDGPVFNFWPQGDS